MNQAATMGVIFDMDGTLMDNNPFHYQAWKIFCASSGRDLTLEEYQNQVSGKVNREILRYLFGSRLSDEEAVALGDRKEALYRENYRPCIRPLTGLMDLLGLLRENQVPTAIATSALPENIRFAMDQLGLGPFFDHIVDQGSITRGKPDPEIFLKAAEKLEIPPGRCLVFEDSIAGIRGAVAAGMPAVGITTSHGAQTLLQAGATCCLKDYRDIRPEFFRNLIP